MAIRFEGIEADIGTCSPMQVVVLVFLNFSFGIQIDSKSKIIKEFLIIRVLVIEGVKLIKNRFAQLIHSLLFMLHSFTAIDQVTLQVSNLLERCIASWSAESLEECMDKVYLTNMTILTYEVNIFLILFDASSCKFANHCVVNKVDVIY